MSANKYGSFTVGEIVNYKGDCLEIIAKEKGNKTIKPNKQGGITTGCKSNPCLYTLSTGIKVRGDKLKHTNPTNP